MKKHWTTYLLGICALLISSCTEREVLIDTPTVAMSREVPINFSGCHVDHAATRHASALREHLSTMGVWGWRNGMWDDNTLVFCDQAVTYNPDSTRWEYTPLQYWREKCQYTFCAYAPHQQSTDSQVSIDDDTHMISIGHVTLHGANLQDTPSDTVKECFRNSLDTDWMVARSGQTAVGEAAMEVEFSMQHILAKLNIRIKECEELAIRPYLSGITADSIVIAALPAQGNFTQQLTHTPILSDPTETDIEEWATNDTTLCIRGSHTCEVTLKPIYLVESLVIPHHIDPTSTITLYYSYHFKDGHTEECSYHMPLTEAFTRFVAGYNHTLTFTVCSTRIEFEAGADDWKERVEG